MQNAAQKIETPVVSQHTPGPWEIGAPNYHHIQVKTEKGLVLIGSVAYSNHLGKNECDANARLIAAAPELLAALKEANKRFEEINEAYNNPAKWPTEATRLDRCFDVAANGHDEVVAAIAKAEGR